MNIFVVLLSQIPHMEARLFFDEGGIVYEKHYTLITSPTEVRLHVRRNERQLFFLSHVPGTLDARETACDIKTLNDQAIVFALTYSDMTALDTGDLDGVIDKNGNSAPQRSASVARHFLTGRHDRATLRSIARGRS